ncbi:MAG TPA: wax ester/triacylglycerol synthase domain-containing protein [Ilumatobacteraceae bacterium]|nr:wax ester/triacylglycerol synthase domain-containing protein [Ilumatobacteraceae bacterium]
MSEAPQFDRKMSDAEGLMWRLEKDPHLSSTFAAVTILDRPPDFDRLLSRLERAVHVVERLGQRVQPAPVNLTAPTWVPDSNFDLRFHVRHIALPKPGTMRQLLDLASLIACDPFDRTRPLWQFVVVDGLRGGKSALIEKLHHTITDGEGSVKLSLQFLDFERDAPEPPPIDHAQLDDRPPPTSNESSNDVFRDLMTGGFRLPLGIVRQVMDLLSDPTGIPDASSAAADTVRGIVNQLGDTEQARSPLWTARSLKRQMEVLRAPFADTRAAAKRLGGTLNTAFLTAAAEAAASYHDKLGSPVEELRASMAISTRSESSGSNAFSLARMLVPTGKMSIAERFTWIQAAAGAARESNSTASLETLAAVASALPTSLITRLARQQAQTVDFATSNVRAAPVPLYVAGAEILQNYAVGPLAGVAFNLTLLSYNHSLDMGVNIDTAAVTEPELLRKCLEKAFTDLIKS